jgi:HTH-type transcriptional regulator, transcriptional repressor of NAD biosynthesis genes
MKTVGLVLGKFMPFHRGHELLLNFASQMVNRLYVVIDKIENEPFTSQIRMRWIKETFPEVLVICLDRVTPQAPEEHPQFWEYWRNVLTEVLPEKPDCLFSSDSYGMKLAEMLEAQYIPFDLNRSCFNISASELRNDLFTNWEYLAKATRKDLLLKVCLFGPESTGKTTLSKQLAKHYNTVYVPEYARLFIESTGNVRKEDMLPIASGQIALENALSQNANRILFCDTDPLLTTIWHEWLFGEKSKEIEVLAENKTYDLYLLTEADLPWDEDKVRYFPTKGKEFMQSCVNTLQGHNRNYALINGKGAKRLQNALSVVDEAVKLFFQL